MLQALTRIDEGYKTTRQIMFAVMATSFLIASFAVYKAFEVVKAKDAELAKMREHVYVMRETGDMAVASLARTDDNRLIEARNHIEMLHSYLFNLDPDPSQIKDNLTKAKALGDNSVATFIDRYKEDNYYENLVVSNASKNVKIEDLQINMEVYPYEVTLKGKERIIRPSSIMEKNLVSTCLLRLANNRTDDNPHAMIVERFKIEDNSLIKEYERY